MPSMIPLRGRADQNNSLEGAPLSDWITNYILAPSVVKSIPVPAGAKHVILSANVDSYVRRNADPAVPSVDITDGSGGLPLPASVGRLVNCENVTTIRYVSASGGISTQEWFA